MTLSLDHTRIEAFSDIPQPNTGGYYGQSRPDMLAYVPDGTRTLLDIGCSGGRFAEAVKNRNPECETWGVEPVTQAASEAFSRVDHVINTPFDAATALPKAHFDVVTMNDCLEHICDTEGTLQAVKSLLKPGGLLILSLPNVSYYVHVWELIARNNWHYGDSGILDRTHFRFFTPKSITEMLVSQGFNVELIRGIPIERPALKWRLLLGLFGNRTQWMRYEQFAVVARHGTTSNTGHQS